MKSASMKSFFSIFIFLLVATSASSQSTNPIPGSLIVQLNPTYTLQSFLEKFPSNNGRQSITLTSHQTLSKKNNIFLLSYPPSFDPYRILEFVKAQSGVKAAQLDYTLEKRNTPNDPFFGDQWDLEQIAVPEAWNITTGGVTPRGDTIVVAITDSGFNTGHLDIRSNLWYNKGEIPNDGIDNDLNGYVDDDQGWNFKLNKNQHSSDRHGHKVAGIVGARGDNNFGTVGVNWQVKMMLLTTTEISHLIEAYDYMIEQRRRYNLSDGEEGAFVVAANLSLGKSRTFCEDQPIWGSMYDLLGEVGILAGVAAANDDYNIEEIGDMPPSCTSDYIIAVTNTNREDRKVRVSAYGTTSIDMGAPGEGSITIDLFEEWGTFGGNSAAAPHLSGAIALLYSLPCEFLATDALSQPAETALVVRQALLDGVDLFSNLQSETATGGRLNVYQSLLLLSENCAASTGELAVIKLYPNPTKDRLTIEMQTPNFEEHEVIVSNALGQIVYRERFFPLYIDPRIKAIDLGNLSAGMYVLTLVSGKERVSKPFIVH